MSIPNNIITGFALTLLVLTTQVGVAVAHPGHAQHDDPALMTPKGRQVAADKATNERLEQEARKIAPKAIRGECVEHVNVPDQGPSCLAANGEWLVELDDGTEVATHGGDPVLAGMLGGTIPTTSSMDAALAGAGPSSVACTTNPRVPHYRLIYSRASDQPDRSGTIIPALRDELYKASAVLNEQAQRTAPGVARKLRVWCSGGLPAVNVEQLSIDNNNDTFAAIASQLRGRGYNSPEPQVARYLIYHDGIVGEGTYGWGGQADSTWSTSADPYGPNNATNRYAIDYADAIGVPDWFTLLHESMHNMGAVTTSAPDSNGYGHCRTDHDVMCYAEQGVSTYLACPYLQLDCGDNSYFHAGTPPIGSYLANNWNAGRPNNRFIDHGSQTVDYTRPSAPTSLASSGVGFSSATVSWTAALDDVGITAYRVGTSWSSIGPFVTHSESSSTSRTVTGLTPGTTNYIRVEGLDARGHVGVHAQLAVITPIDNTAPSQPASFTSSGHSESGFTLTWSAATDDDQVASYLLERFTDSGWVAVATIAAPTTSYVISGQAANTPFDLSIRARDRSGNVGIRRTHATSTAPDSTPPATPTGILGSGGFATASITWAPVSDYSGISHYEVELLTAAGVAASTVTTGTSVGLAVPGGVTYTIRVLAVDGAGNRSSHGVASVYVSAPPPPPPVAPPPTCASGQIGTWPNCTTPVSPTPPPPAPIVDRVAPSPPRAVVLERSFLTAVRLRYIAGSDNDAFHSTRVYRFDGRQWRLVRAVSGRGVRRAFVGGLRRNTAYRLKLHSRDASGNFSKPVFITIRTLR